MPALVVDASGCYRRCGPGLTPNRTSARFIHDAEVGVMCRDSGVPYRARQLIVVCCEVENLRAILAEHPTAPWPDKVEP
jgi:hypothetical protein